jgi:type II secretory pathway pseudopilin PulG
MTKGTSIKYLRFSDSLYNLFTKGLRMRNSGFTIVELVVSMVVMFVLASLTISKFSGFIEKAKASEIPTIFSVIQQVQHISLEEGGPFLVARNHSQLNSNLGIGIPSKTYFNYSTGLTKHGKAGESGLGIIFGQGMGLHKEDGFWVNAKPEVLFGGLDKKSYLKYAYFSQSNSEGVATNSVPLAGYLRAYLSGMYVSFEK